MDIEVVKEYIDRVGIETFISKIVQVKLTTFIKDSILHHRMSLRLETPFEGNIVMGKTAEDGCFYAPYIPILKFPYGMEIEKLQTDLTLPIEKEDTPE